MNSFTKLVACALILAQLLGTIHCRVYFNTDTWVASGKSQNFPENAVLGGVDSSGYDNFVGRVSYLSSILPARVQAENGLCSFNTDSVADQTTTYELLVANETVSYHWVRSYDGFRERNAVAVGTSSLNERVYVCRARTDGGLFVGTLYPVKKMCFIRYENNPLRQFSKYEVLVRKIRPAPWMPFNCDMHKNTN